MEAVKEKKPKAQVRASVPPQLPDRPVVVNGLVLPEVPAHPVGTTIAPLLDCESIPSTSQQIDQQERSSSPDPEEIIIEDKEHDVVESTEPENVSTEVDLPYDVGKLIFPKTNFIMEESNIELPIPREESSDVVLEAEEERPILPAYPCVPELTSDVSEYPVMEVPPSYVSAPFMSSCITEDAHVYPKLSQVIFSRTEHGLMIEQELLNYYHNPLYETIDEFVDMFVKVNEFPSGPLFSLLQRLKKAAEDLSLSSVSEKENTDAVNNSFRDCWSSFMDSKDFKGKCGDNREGVGKVQYPSYIFSNEAFAELQKLISTNRNILLDHVTSQETTFRSVALQIQWQIVGINSLFMGEHGLTAHSAPSLIEHCNSSPGRSLLLCALSDLFFHLRAPHLPKRFTDAVTSWIIELTVVLQMACLPADAQFILNHIMRLPSPVAHWAAPLVQTFIQSSCTAKLKVDYCIVMLSHVLNPIKSRVAFLKLIAQSEKEDSAWTMLSDDADEEGDFSFVTINEGDLTTLLEQLPIQEIYSCAYLNFTTQIPDRTAQFLSLLAFQLVLMKIFDDGLTTYAKPMYKQFCKQIGVAIRKSVQVLSSHWRITRDMVPHVEGEQLQREFDRVMLLVLQYLINRDSSGLWQFLVDLPYDCVSEDCKKRCEFLLRSLRKYTIKELYDIPLSVISEENRKGGLKERAERLSNVDAVFIINAVATIASYSVNDPAPFLKEVIEVCFCDESSRESLYKVGGEGIATMISRKPGCLDVLLSVIDRNMEHIGTYAINVLSSASLESCKISENILSILGKWLISRSPSEAANRLARRVLSGLYWGYSSKNTLWIDEKIHMVCADIVMKAHSVHCGSSNGMIAKSIKQITKLASKMADHEQLFLQFCWDILIKLKLPVTNTSLSKSHNDLAAYYLDLAQYCLKSSDVFLANANLLNELISSGSSTAAVISLSRILYHFYSEIDTLCTSKLFLEVFVKIIHVDQCSYAVQWLSGPSSVPTPIIRLICSSISFYAKRVSNVGSYLRAWIELLCIRGPDGWNSDQAVLQILGTISRIAFMHDPSNFLGIVEQLHIHYTRKMIPSAKEKSKGMFSIFASTPPAALLIEDTYLNVSVPASYLLLLIESKSFPEFYQLVWETLSKKDKNTMEIAVNKASSKTSTFLTLNYCSPYRWATFLPLCNESPFLPIVLQRLATESYVLRKVNGQNCQFARKILDCPATLDVIQKCKHFLMDCPDEKGLVKAVSGWLFTSAEVSHRGFDFSIFDLDYLLQLILSNETNIWMEFLNIHELQSAEDIDNKLFITTCHLDIRERAQEKGVDVKKSLLSPHSHALPFASLPNHPGLPLAPVVDPNMATSYQLVLGKTEPLITTINQLADEAADVGDKLMDHDQKYFDLIPRRFAPTSKNLPITIRCTSSCHNPINRQITVSPMELDGSVDAQIASNRAERNSLYTTQSESLINRTAVETACLEHIARQLVAIYSGCQNSSSVQIQATGRTLFYRIINLLSGNALLFSAVSSTFENSLRTLGERFIKNHSNEQIEVMQHVLDGFILSDPLVESFTPECLSAVELCNAYGRMSAAVRDPERCSRALKLLGRLAIDKTAVNLPPHQFAPLLPMAFQNLESQADTLTELHQLCLQHVVTFVFHAFPSNFVAGLDLAVQGCAKGTLPVSLLEHFVRKMGAEEYQKGNADFCLPSIKCTECISLLTLRMSEARGRLQATLYSVMGRYLQNLTSLMQLFVFSPIKEGFSVDIPISVMQKDLMELFGRTVGLWSSLIIPTSPTIPPFSPSHEKEVNMVLENFVELLTSFPQNAYLPPGSQNIQSLVWQLYYEKLSNLSQGTAFYYSSIETQLMRLSWNNFYPTIHGLRAMDDCLASKSQDCASFVTQLFVRVLWKDNLERNISQEIRPSYMATLFSCLVRITSRRSFYTKVAASLLQEMKTLSLRNDWSLVTVEDATALAETVSAVMPFDSLFNASEHVSVLQIIWRKVCQFSPKEQFSTTALMKQQLWCKTQCALLLRGGESNVVPAYNSLISEVNTVGTQHENLRAFVTVARELMVFWTTIPDSKFGESVVNVWNNYLAHNPESPLVLCCINVIVSALKPDQFTTALKVLDKTITIYFKRINCNWSGLLEWIQFPVNIQQQIFNYLICIPTSENKVEPLHLTLKAFLDYGHHPDSTYLSVHNYLVNLKPKHVVCEASLIILIIRFLSWYSHYCQSLPSRIPINEDPFPPLLRWLDKSAKDESSFFSNLVKSKKTSYSPKLRVILTILSHYLTQQSQGEGLRPRCEENSPVFNSRIQALKDSSSQKTFVTFSNAFNVATSYFTQVDIHHIGSAPLLTLRCSNTVFKEKFLTNL